MDKRIGPKTTPANKLTEEEKDKIVEISTTKKYMDLPPCQIVPMLADEGKYIASESTFYRVLKDRKLLTHRGRSKAPSKSRPQALVARGPNEIYSWDITYLPSQVAGKFYYLYMFMDIFSRKIVGFEVHDNECNIKASDLIKKIYLNEKISGKKVILHSDNGGPMKGATMLATLQKLGVIPSFSRPRVSDDNPYSESLFKTLKYCPTYPRRAFEDLRSANNWVFEFVDWYNNQHLHSGIKFVTPSSRHAGDDKLILEKRAEVYQKAKSEKPNRWSKEIRDWSYLKKVHLNNLQKRNELDIKMAS